MPWPRDVRRADLRVDYYRGSGPGGQNKNKRDTACRIVHLPTRITATAEEQRTQGLNRVAAFRRLAKRLEPLMRLAARIDAQGSGWLSDAELARRLQERCIVGESDPRSDANRQARVRTYSEPRGEVVDHRVPGVRWNYRDVLDGSGIDVIIGALHGVED
jgi:protein subunit release factor A